MLKQLAPFEGLGKLGELEVLSVNFNFLGGDNAGLYLVDGYQLRGVSSQKIPDFEPPMFGECVEGSEVFLPGELLGYENPALSKVVEDVVRGL